MKIYFAAPLFNIAERCFNEELCCKLENIGFTVFLPQRDGAENSINNYRDLKKEDKRKAIFYTDYAQIIDSDIFLFILDGRIPDEGACVELGIAYTDKQLRAKNRIIIGLHTDSRAAFIGSKLNPMLRIPIEVLCESTDEVILYLTKLLCTC